MSLPLTRRIAKAALLTAAGAATVVGAAGVATAAPPQPADRLGGLNLDTPITNGPLGDTTSNVTGLATRAGDRLVPAGKDLLGEPAKISQDGDPTAGLPL